MADGAMNPNFTQEEFDKEKDKLLENLKTQEKNVLEYIKSYLIFSAITLSQISFEISYLKS